MNIALDHIGKRFNAEWIFKQFSYEFKAGERYAITGHNGSGKSTLLQVIGGYLQQNSGTISYRLNQLVIASENIYRHTAIAAPYLELIEEMTLREFLTFHSRMRPFINGYSISDIAETVSLSHVLDKQIRYYSSGMKQRVKLAQAFFTQANLLLLDEPLTNLDAQGAETYYRLIDNFTGEKTVIISSNDSKEYHFCSQRILISDYK